MKVWEIYVSVETCDVGKHKLGTDKRISNQFSTSGREQKISGISSQQTQREVCHVL